MFAFYRFRRLPLHSPSPPQDERPDPASFQDNPFLEVLLAAVCKAIPSRRDESFVDQARRWTEALAAMTALQPNTRYQWYMAAEVARKQFAALHSLALYQRKGASAKNKQKHGLDFIELTKAMQDALLRYDLLRNQDAAP